MKLFNKLREAGTAKNTPEDVRAAFPLLVSQDIAYLDSAATTQKPAAVLEAMDHYYRDTNANVHRGVYKLADASTQAFEDARHAVAKYLDRRDDEIVFTSGATHSLNLAARLLEHTLRPGDEIVVTVAEHHALFVPFQQLAKRTNVKLVVVPLTADGTMTEARINEYISPKTAIVAVSAMSNVLGYRLDTRKLRKEKAFLVIDAAQSIRHTGSYPNADLVAFSGHKLYGPQGIGVLAGTRDILRDGEPLLTGGGMIQSVTIAKSEWGEPPVRYEAGTPNIAGAVGLAAALAWFLPRQKEAERREAALTEKAVAIIAKYGKILGPQHKDAPIIAFHIEGTHGHDVAQVLDGVGVCVRAGHHCCQPLHDALGVDLSVRVSIAYYNTEKDLERLEEGLRQVLAVFS